MSNRAEKLLQASGIHESLISSLERGDTIFVLTSGTLVYQDSSGTRRVTLRDLTRIHSDQDGMLRVETPAGTALTATLLGFDPVDVQTFFGQVRDTTARVKQAPPAPVPPTPAAPAAPRPSASVPPTSPSTPPSTAPTGFQESVKVIGQAAAPSREPKEPTLIIPSPAAESRNPTLVTTPPIPSRNPTQITPPPAPSRNPTLVTEPARTAAPVAPARTPAPPPPPVAAAQTPVSNVPPRPETKPVEVKAVRVAEPKAADLAVASTEAEAADLPTNGKPVRVPQSAVGTLAALAANAEGVRSWVIRLRFMSVLMLLAALALAYFQMKAGQGLTGIWVLIAGGMGAVGLWALADLTKLLVSLASAVSAEGGVMDVD